jgi:hypothetical protein
MAINTLDRNTKVSGRAFRTAMAVLALSLAGTATVAQAQDTIGGHVGFVLPLVTRAGGQTTNQITDNFSMGMPVGITVKGQGSMAFDFELVPAIHLTGSHQTSLTVHPGLIRDVGHHFAVGMRAAFDVNTASWGFTPLVNHSWPIKNETSFFKAYFIEADMPVRFNRPVGEPASNPATFAMHFGLGF